MKKLLLFFMFLGVIAASTAIAQSKKISGKVLGADDGLPLPGVTVKIQGTTVGVLTDGDGNFSLAVNPGQILVFSYVGFTSQTVIYRGTALPVIKMASASNVLQEVVVRDAYGAQAKKSYTGAAASVGGADLENKPFSSFQSALSGALPGVAVTSNSGQPGANVQIRIRGLSSITLSSQPLYVVDGMFVNSGDLSSSASTSNALAGINDNDIENITVLKDAAATAIYGSRGSAGVIEITTKKGKSGKTVVRFDAEYGRTQNNKVPDAGKLLTPDQYRTLFDEAFTNAGYTAAQLASLHTTYGLDAQGVNWYDIVTKNGQQQQYNVSLNGGDDKTRIFSSAGYFKQEATVLNSNLRKITGIINVDHTISKRFSTSTGLNFSNVQQNTPLQGSAYFSSAIASAYFLSPFQQPYAADGSINQSVTGNTNFPVSGNSNPLYIAAHDQRLLGQTRILGNETIKWNIWDQLKYTGYASVDLQSLEETTFLNPIMGDGRSLSGTGRSQYTRYFNWLSRHQLDYRYNIPHIDDTYINVSAGYEAQRNTAYFNNAYSTGYPATQPTLTAVAVAATPTSATESTSNYTFDALYTRAAASFKNRYSISGSFRREGSSRFGINNQFGNFYSFGGAWSIDQEAFFKKQSIFTTAKIRSSYGQTGNANGLGNYLWRPTAGYGANYNLANGQVYNTIGNADLTWEKSKKFDLGVDFGFFNDRLSFAFDYYKNTIDGVIQQVSLSRTTGFSSQYQNIGSMENKGYEFSVKGTPIKTRDFTWTANFNLARNINKVTKLANPDAPNPSQTSLWLAQGYDYYTFYTRLYAGVDPANGNALWYTDGTKTATTTSYTAAQRVPFAQADPKIISGFSSTFNYKGVYLTADFYGSFGNMVSDSWGTYLQDGGNFLTANKYQYELNRWTTPGQITDVPKLVYGGGSSAQSASFSSRLLYYGDFIRLKNLAIGYDFKNIEFVKSLGISRLSVYGRGTNLWTKTYDKRLPFDPEVPTTGFSTLDIPLVKTFTVGINVGF